MRTRSAIRWFLTLALGGASICLAGCYERVVGARGLGADQYTVSEPYQENSKVDDWLFGSKTPTKPSRRLSTPE